MRENIGLFRGRAIDVVGDYWAEGFYVHLKDIWKEKESHRIYNMYAETDCGEFYTDWYEVDPDTIGECTGLRDKNGKLAFEHDVTEDRWGGRWIIFGCEGGFGICRNIEWTRNSDGSVIIWNALADAQNADWFSHQHTIIGNIVDNPELLKGGEEE